MDYIIEEKICTMWHLQIFSKKNYTYKF